MRFFKFMLRHRWSALAFRLGMALAPAFTVLLSGCASFSPDAGMGAVTGIAATELRKDALKIDGEEAATAAGARVRRLLASTLSVDAAVQIALLNNKGLQAAYNELGIAEAVMVEASLPPNPAFSISRLSTSVELDIERRIVGDILALATLPARANIAADRFHQAQLRAAEATLRVAAETRRNHYRAVASRQLASFLSEAGAAAETAAKLAKQLGETGAMNKLPQTLPAVPRRPMSLPAVEMDAVRRRVDLQVARIEVDTLAKSYGLTNATRFINLLEVAGVSRTQREAGGARGTGGGVEVEFQVPIFDFGEARLRQAGESYA